MKLFWQDEDDYDIIECPICGNPFYCSDYLKSVIDDELVLWFANMIMHYRHNHIESWNKCWSKNGNSYRQRWFKDYDSEKRKVNERAKRQIIRKCKNYLIEIGMTVEHVMQLQFNDQKTTDLAIKYLPAKL